MTSRTFTTDETQKLKDLINAGVSVRVEIDTLNDGLKDTVKTLAEELDVKPAVLNRAIRSAYKADLDKKRDEFSELESILESIGRA